MKLVALVLFYQFASFIVFVFLVNHNRHHYYTNKFALLHSQLASIQVEYQSVRVYLDTMNLTTVFIALTPSNNSFLLTTCGMWFYSDYIFFCS